MDYRKAEAKDASRARFRGIWAAITTPFTADLEVDEAGLRRNMRYLTGALGVDGVFCTGVMGEFWSLTREERKRIVEVVVEEARGKCGVIAQTGSHSAHETVELTRHAEAAGADFAIMMAPYRARPLAARPVPVRLPPSRLPAEQDRLPGEARHAGADWPRGRSALQARRGLARGEAGDRVTAVEPL